MKIPYFICNSVTRPMVVAMALRGGIEFLPQTVKDHVTECGF